MNSIISMVNKFPLSKEDNLIIVFDVNGNIIWQNNKNIYKKDYFKNKLKLTFMDRVRIKLIKEINKSININIKIGKNDQNFNVNLFDSINKYYIAISDNTLKISNIISKIDFFTQKDKTFYLMNFNIDNFKKINHLKGYYFGNLILNDFRNKLNEIFNSEIIYNIYCDHFIVISHECKRKLINKLNKLLLEEKLEYSKFKYSVSVGLVDYPLDSKDGEGLLLASEKALSIAKENYFSEKKICDYFRKGTSDYIYSYFAHRKINSEEFHICYQPIITTESPVPIGYEALLRWENKKMGVVSPGLFIPIAEELGCIYKVTEIVLKKVVEDFFNNYDFFESKFLTINISVNDLFNSSFKSLLDDLNQKYPKIIKKLVFEITESLEFQEFDIMNEKIKDIQSYGIKIFIDDFGTGYSSLDKIMNIGIDGLKIDRGITNNLLKKESHKILLESMMFLAKNLEIDLVIEGIETVEQYEYIKKNNKCLLQGYYFSKPKKLSNILNKTLVKIEGV